MRQRSIPHRHETLLSAGDACEACGGGLKRVGEDVFVLPQSPYPSVRPFVCLHGWFTALWNTRMDSPCLLWGMPQQELKASPQSESQDVKLQHRDTFLLLFWPVICLN